MKGEKQTKVPAATIFRGSPSKTSQKKSSQKRDAGAAGAEETNEKSKRVKIAEESIDETLHGSFDTEWKWFNDPVHGNITMEPLCLEIINTPEYQRLQGMKQLGVCDKVYRGATHTRFEHSLGVAHLAGKLARSLRNNQPQLGITDKDILCVKVAGLCHDLGHGPYSHLYDGVFIRRMHPDGIDNNGKKWRHEDGSVLMFNHLLEVNHIEWGKKHHLSVQDKTFIEEIIGGVEGKQRQGRSSRKFFLYDIVNNTRSGLDVDKLDYYVRDVKMTNINITFVPNRFMELAMIMPVDPPKKGEKLFPRSQDSVHSSRSSSHHSQENDDDNDDAEEEEAELMICYPEKMVQEAVQFFRTRFELHHAVYQHKTVKAVEFMITDALVLADPYITIPGMADVLTGTAVAAAAGKSSASSSSSSSSCSSSSNSVVRYKMSECIHNMSALSKLKDSIVDVIRCNDDERLDPARAILDRIDRRELYRCVGSSRLTREDTNGNKTEQQIKTEILRISQGAHQQWQSYSSSHGGSGLGHGLGSTSFSAHISSQPSQTGVNVNASYGSQNSGLDPHTQDPNLQSQSIGATVSSSSNGHLHPNHHDNDDDHDVLSQDDDNEDFSRHSTNYFQDIGCSQESNMSCVSALGATDPVLEDDDIIVEIKDVHYGLHEKNPVSRMRFFRKGLDLRRVKKMTCDALVKSERAREVPEPQMEQYLPRVFETKEIRVFCRVKEKERTSRKAFDAWCKEYKTVEPFPSSPYPNDNGSFNGQSDAMDTNTNDPIQPRSLLATVRGEGGGAHIGRVSMDAETGVGVGIRRERRTSNSGTL